MLLVKLYRATRFKALRQVASFKKAPKHPHLNQRHKTKRIEWAKKYTKVNFSELYLQMNAVLRWMVLTAGLEAGFHRIALPPSLIARQQGGGGVMFWAAIVGHKRL